MKFVYRFMLLLSVVTVCVFCLSACDGAAHEHTFSEWEVSVEATCTAEGEEVRECSGCEEKQTRPIVKKEHTYGDWVETTAATCEVDGVETRTCECGEAETRVITATGHSFGEWQVTLEAKCEVDGEETRVCDCGQTQTRPLTALEHSYGDWNTVTLGTCEQKGTENRICGLCNDEEIRETDFGEHIESDLVIDIDSTVIENGKGHTECTTCNQPIRTEISISKKTSVGLKYQVNSDGVTCQITGRGSCTDTQIGIPSSIDGYTVTGVDEWAFSFDANITAIGIPETITELEMYCFSYLDNLKSIVIPDTVKIVGEGVFIGCVKLESVVLPNSITSVPNGTFEMCESLVNVKLPDNATRIGRFAFDRCSSLESITIPESVTYLGASCFEECKKLKTINFLGTMAQWKAITKATDWNKSMPKCVVVCSDGTI